MYFILIGLQPMKWQISMSQKLIFITYDKQTKTTFPNWTRHTATPYLHSIPEVIFFFQNLLLTYLLIFLKKLY